jgi:Cu2+-exporting ATPase
MVHTLAAAAFLGWVFIGGMAWQDAMMIAVTVLIITCPCALGLAVPVVQVLAGAHLMRSGILLKSGDALERLARIDTAIFDKTGTLTQGKPVLKKGTFTKNNLQNAAALAAHSSHPLARALASSFTGKLPDATNVKEHPGKGMSGTIEGKKFRLGSRAWCGDKSAPDSNDMELFLKPGRGSPVRFTFTDDIRPDVKTVLDDFRYNGIHPVLLSGDRTAPVRNVAEICAFDTFYAEKTPPQKFSIMEELRAQGRNILMVGDGLNDAPVLAGADVSIAPGSAIHLARNTADILFMGDSLKPVLEVYKTACKAQSLIRQNFTLAILYNMIAVPLAMAGYVTPLVAAVAMSGSSLMVILNAFKLKAKNI